jgi:hypothetical protein
MQPVRTHSNALYIAPPALVCVFITICAAAMWWQPLTADENEFFLAIANWKEWRYLIPHPHLYVHWAQGLFALLGANVGALRVSVLLPNLATVGYRARIRNHGHSCFLCEIVIRSQFHTHTSRKHKV